MLVNATEGKLSQKLPKEVSPSLKILEQYLENGLGKRKISLRRIFEIRLGIISICEHLLIRFFVIISLALFFWIVTPFCIWVWAFFFFWLVFFFDVLVYPFLYILSS